jgi:two-component system, OmpR family, phosphate regulon response regulator OmpR
MLKQLACTAVLGGVGSTVAVSKDQKQLLVLDDDAALRGMLQRYLSEQGFVARAVQDGAQLDRLLARESFDLLVLDLMMPGEDGLSICRRLRANREMIPIIMLTAKGDPIDRIVGLEMGADDYLAKPFNPRELLARINALLRRQLQIETAARITQDEVLQFGDCVIVLAARVLRRGATAVELTSREFDLLRVLISNRGRPLSRTRLVELTRGNDFEGTERSIDVQVVRLRKPIEADPANPRYVQTVWGHGYMFAPDGSAA